ncbi:hypothetical protein [Psychrobacter pulmonis]
MDGQLTRLPDNQNYPFDQASMIYSQSQFLKLMTDDYIKEIKSGRRHIDEFYKSLQKLSTADARSLLYISNSLLDKSSENIIYDDDDYKNLLIEQLENCTMPIERYNFLIELKAKNILPENYLEWFKNDLRCSLFLMSLIQSAVSDYAYKGKKELVTGISNLLRYHISILNCTSYNLDYKDEILRDGDWNTVFLLSIKSTYLKGRTENKELKWLDASNHEQIEWACDYLEKNKYTILKGVFFPETIEEKYELILASLDRLSNIESDDVGTEKNKGYSPRSYALFSIKKAWDGQKQNDSKSKTSDGVIKIYKKNQAKLDELAKKNNITVNKLINKYIEDAHKEVSSPNDQSEKQVFKYTEEHKADEKNMSISSKEEVPSDSNSIKPPMKITSPTDNEKKHHNVNVKPHRKKVFEKPTR